MVFESVQVSVDSALNIQITYKKAGNRSEFENTNSLQCLEATYLLKSSSDRWYPKCQLLNILATARPYRRVLSHRQESQGSRLTISTIMAKKDAAIKKATAAAQAAVNSKTTVDTKTDSDSSKKTVKTKSPITQSIHEVTAAINSTYANYIDTLTPRLKLIDAFLVFLVLLGVLQFVYVLLVGNFPFNAFLGGFISCVGQFVLTVSLRLQYKISEGTKKTDADQEKSQVSPERAFGDYIFASLILHFIVYHFIN